MIQWHGHHGVMVYSKEDYIIQLPLEELANPKFQLIYMHPEVCVHKKKVIGFFNTCIYQEQVRRVVVNEPHLVLNWYVLHDFLSSFSLMKHFDERLELLTSITCQNIRPLNSMQNTLHNTLYIYIYI